MEQEKLIDRVAGVFRAKPNSWIDGRDLAKVGGAYASRTRISECRRLLGMQIDNRVYGKGDYRVSEYRYVPEGGDHGVDCA